MPIPPSAQSFTDPLGFVGYVVPKNYDTRPIADQEPDPRRWKALSRARELRSLKRAPRRLAKEGTASRRLYRWTRDRLGGRR